MEGNADLSRTYNHIAFKVADCDLESYESRIRELGLEFKTPRPRVEGEGRSLYFYDYDNHLFELHSGTLAARLARYQVKAK